MQTKEAEKQWRAIMRFDHQDMVCCTLTLAKRYLAEFPDHGFAWVWLAISLSRVARYPEALSALRRAARLCPPKKLHLVQNQFGHLYQQKGCFRRAEAWFRRAITSRPSDAGAYIYLGALLALEGRLPEAEAVHSQATRCKDGCLDEAFFNLGLVLRAQERYAEARTCFRKALELDPKYKPARKELSDVERVIELHRNA
jgi:tetratricopeptide (TPR) repeat protein